MRSTSRSRPRLGHPTVVGLCLVVSACTSTTSPGTTAVSTSLSSSLARATPATAPSEAATITSKVAGSPASAATATSSAARRPSTTEPRQSTSGRSGTCVAGRCYTVGPLHQLPAGVAPESSGIVASALSPGVFFVVDDGTGTNQIVAVRSDGALVAEIGVAGMSARNAEALAAGPCGDRAGRCIYVGDIGDNGAQRKRIHVYRVREPGLTPAPTEPVPADNWTYTYPDGPHNAEAMVIDSSGALIVITKSAPNATGVVPPHRIYRGSSGGGELRFVSSFTPPQPAEPLQSVLTGTVVTDANFAKGRLLLLTYDEVIEYIAPTATADPAGFPRWPHHALPDPPMIQSEGITADVSGCGYEVTSEQGPGGTNAGLAGVNCQ